MKFIQLARLSVCLLALSSSCYGDVDFWEVSKGAIYDQTADNTAPDTSTNWFIFAAVETDSAADANSATLEGGNVSGSLAFEWFDGEWELFVQYPTKAALDADFPAGGTYSIELSGGTLGSVTQEFDIDDDAYPDTPYLVGADYSSLQALAALEPFELNWNNFETSAVSVAFQISEDSIFDGDEVLYESWGFAQTAFVFSNDLLTAGQDYDAVVEFVNSTDLPDTGGFGAEGSVAFAALVRFPMFPDITAEGYDEFTVNGASSQWSPLFPPDEATDTFSVLNGRLEYISPGDDDTFIAWEWDEFSLSSTQDWSVAIDITQTQDAGDFSGDAETFFGLLVMADGNLDDNISAEFINSGGGREIATFASVDGDEVVTNTYASISNETASLKISYDAKTELIHTAYSLGGDYMVQTNFPAFAWGITPSTEFDIVVFGGNELTEMTSGDAYADNFRVYGEPVISNLVRFVEAEYIKGFGSPDNVEDDVREWNVMMQTDQRATSAIFTIPIGEQNEFEDVYDAGEVLSWEFEDEDDISEPFDTDLDGEWLFTVGLSDGTFHSTVIPFTKEDGVTAIPVMTNQPLFSAVNLAGDLSSVVFEWDTIDPLANIVEISKEVGDEDDLVVGFYTDGITDEVGLAPSADGPLSTQVSSAAPLDAGKNTFVFGNTWARTAYNDEGVPYVAIKLSDSIYVIDTEDLDGDGMDDAWEIEFFGSTNAVNGGASEDFDLDGQNNLDEFIGGANPTNDASVFAIGMAEASPAGFILSWTAIEDRYYGVYWAESLTNEFEALELYMEYPRNSYTDMYHTVENSGFYVIDVMPTD